MDYSLLDHPHAHAHAHAHSQCWSRHCARHHTLRWQRLHPVGIRLCYRMDPGGAVTFLGKNVSNDESTSVFGGGRASQVALRYQLQVADDGTRGGKVHRDTIINYLLVNEAFWRLKEMVFNDCKDRSVSVRPKNKFCYLYSCQLQRMNLVRFVAPQSFNRPSQIPNAHHHTSHRRSDVVAVHL